MAIEIGHIPDRANAQDPAPLGLGAAVVAPSVTAVAAGAAVGVMVGAGATSARTLPPEPSRSMLSNRSAARRLSGIGCELIRTPFIRSACIRCALAAKRNTLWSFGRSVNSRGRAV